MKLPHNSPDVKSISEENYVLVKARGNLCWCSWDVILFLPFPLCTSERRERPKKQLVYGYFFHSSAFFASIFPFCFLIPPSFHLCLLPVRVNFHTQPWDDSSNDFYQHTAVEAGTKMISPRALQQGAAYISESYPMLARDDLGTKVLLWFLPGSGMIPEINFLSLDCAFWLAEPGFCFLGFEAAGSCLFGRNSVHGRGEEQGI